MRLAKNWLVSAVAVMALAAPAFAAEKDIVDTAVGAGSFNTLVAAVKAAGLVDTLKGKGPFTVFAPTDEAFAKLPAGTVETLLKPENKQKLIDILKYHVVPANVKAADVVKLTSAPTVNGQRATVKVADGGVKVDNANVVKTDIACTNGTIHVIDAVILPSADTIPTVADKAGSFKTLLAAAKAAFGRGALSSRADHRVRSDRRGVRQVACWNCRISLEARKQAEVGRHSQVPCCSGPGVLGRRSEGEGSQDSAGWNRQDCRQG
jgi:uncharacterized surface protein with fasciclin (FAS1) repeats